MKLNNTEQLKFLSQGNDTTAFGAILTRIFNKRYHTELYPIWKELNPQIELIQSIAKETFQEDLQRNDFVMLLALIISTIQFNDFNHLIDGLLNKELWIKVHQSLQKKEDQPSPESK